MEGLAMLRGFETDCAVTGKRVRAVLRCLNGEKPDVVARDVGVGPAEIVQWCDQFVAAGTRAIGPQGVNSTRDAVSEAETALGRFTDGAGPLPAATEDRTAGYEEVLSILMGPLDGFMGPDCALEGAAQAILEGSVNTQLRGALHQLARACEARVDPDEANSLRRVLDRSGKQLLKRSSAATKKVRKACRNYLKVSKSQSMDSVLGRATEQLGRGQTLFGAVISIASQETGLLENRLNHEDALEGSLAHLRSEIAECAVELYEAISRIMDWVSSEEAQEHHVAHEEALEKAADAYDKERYSEAVNHALVAIRARPSESAARVIAGYALMSIDELVASKHLMSGIEPDQCSDDLRPLLLAGRAELELRSGEPQKALQLLAGHEAEFGVELIEKVRRVRASALLNLGERSSAIQELTEFVVETPDALDQILAEDEWERTLTEQEVASLRHLAKERVDRYLQKLCTEYGGGLFQEFARWPGRKKRSALHSYVGLTQDEHVIIAHDSTAFGGAKEGVVFTNKAIYWKELLSNPGCFTYEQISTVERHAGCLEVNGQEVIGDDDDLASFVYEALVGVCGLS